MTNTEILVCLTVLIASCQQSIGAWNNDKVKLKDINVLTLYDGKYTTARRGSPIPQLKCVGGSACHAFRPQVVQCYNRGTDGYDVQWECKTDMDNAFRFGKVEVSCEGYDYPEDDYILRGSCGLEYTLEYTKEGHQQQGRSHDYYGSHSNTYNDDYHNRPTNTQGFGSRARSVVGDVIFLCVIGGVVYVIYKTCVASNNYNHHGTSGNNRNYGNHYNQGPPPPGFRPETYPDNHCGSTYDDGYTHNQGHRNQNGGFGGFWSGAATGGLLGYMFGNRNNGYYGSRTYAPHTGSSFWGNSYRSPTSSSFFSSSSGSSFGGGGSTGTRTASGFGGTKRR